ncbi:MAM and LDL-receptor class A domain-containing protein 1-like [Diadema setosum]|uniref:MAM and LDL-receptor class A domain-containing protein 1-like n=1 Tax=Diadema setosum TaxID=31175 RepID=UPI003B3A6B6E
MQSGTIAASQLTSSSARYSASYARLYGGSVGWSPATNDRNQWIQIDLLLPHLVTGITIQGHGNAANYYVSSFVLTYMLAADSMWITYRDELGEYFPGSHDNSTPITQTLNPSPVARFIRVHPNTWMYGIFLRLELLGQGPLSVWDGLTETNCTFDVDFCGWVQSTDDDFDWSIRAGDPSTSGACPSFDHTSEYGGYVFVESQGRSGESTAIITGPTFLVPSGHNTTCLRFWSHMTGGDLGTLRVITVEENTTYTSSPEVAFEQRGSQGDAWLVSMVDIAVPASHRFRVTFEVVIGSGDVGCIAIDDVELLNGDCLRVSYRVDCDYEVDLCGWTQDLSNNADWQRGQGTIGTPDTGPSSDHTSGDGYYLYAATSSDQNSKVLSLRIPVLLSSSGWCFSFWYYMQGVSSHELVVKVTSIDNMNNTTHVKEAFRLFGTQGDYWIREQFAITNISTAFFTIGIEVSTPASPTAVGIDYGEVAIDDATLTAGQCDTGMICLSHSRNVALR